MRFFRAIGLSAWSIERSGVITTAAGHYPVAQALPPPPPCTETVAYRHGIPVPRTAFVMQSTGHLDGESVTALFDTAAQANFVSAAFLDNFLDKVGWQARVYLGCAGCAELIMVRLTSCTPSRWLMTISAPCLEMTSLAFRVSCRPW